jgi:hypothetical protein
MTPEDYWKKPLRRKKGTRKYLRNQPFYYDFEWNAVFPSCKKSWSRFPGLKTVSEVVATHVPGDDWSGVVIILTSDAEQPVTHEELDGRHYFVFDSKSFRIEPIPQRQRSSDLPQARHPRCLMPTNVTGSRRMR